MSRRCPHSLTATVDKYLDALTEADVPTRRALIEQAWVDDGRMIEPQRKAKGHLGLSRVASIQLIELPGYTYHRVSAVEQERDGTLRFSWHLIGPDGIATLGGVDVATVSSDGRLNEVTRRYETYDVTSTRSRPAAAPDAPDSGRPR